MSTTVFATLAAATVALPAVAGAMLANDRDHFAVTPAVISEPAPPTGADALAETVPKAVATTPLPGFETYEWTRLDGRDVVIDKETRRVVAVL